MSQKDDIIIGKHFIDATQKVLSTMAFLQAVPGRPVSLNGKPGGAGDISAIIGVTGACTGSISVSFTREAAIKVVKGMLGDEVDGMDETALMQDAMDAVGEIINMISGMARATLSEAGLVMQGSTPSVVAGKDHTILHQGRSPGVAIPFTLDGSRFSVEFILDAKE